MATGPHHQDDDGTALVDSGSGDTRQHVPSTVPRCHQPWRYLLVVGSHRQSCGSPRVATADAQMRRCVDAMPLPAATCM